MSGPRILIVDDQAAMRRGVERLLTRHYHVGCAASAREALEIAEELAPDLAILDVRMPETDGFALMGLLRERHPDVDVIFMTGAIHEVDAQIIRAIRERAFYFIQKPFDREVLLTLVERCLEQRRLSAENALYTEQLERELDDARSFQRSMLPAPDARFGPVSLAAQYEPCDQLGGDLYDYVSHSAGTALLVADVSGHGVTAAMLTAIVKSAFHDAHVDDFDPQSVCTRVAGALRPFDEGRFVTLFCGNVTPDGSRLSYVNAGHPPPIFWGRDREQTTLTRTAPLLSPAFPDLEWEGAAVDLRGGDRLVIYTDGVTEMRAEDDSRYGEERLHAALAGLNGSARDLLDWVSTDARRFAAERPSEDDVTLLGLALDES